MKSAGKARNNGIYRHIRTSKEIIRNLLNDFCNKHILADFGNTFVFCTTQRLWLDGSTSSEKIQKVIICYC